MEKKREPPALIKEQVKKRFEAEKKPGKKRGAKHHRGRIRALPTHLVEHRWEATVWRYSAGKGSDGQSHGRRHEGIME
ncbi:MAG TPA: hypothetical protein VGF67_18820 [Ktedonobacteraceae bacterium]|jgi:hypothetical protein